MKRIIVTYGIISGIIVAVLMFLTMPLWDSGVVNFGNGMVVGYTTMVIALSLIFFAIRSYRDNVNGGAITFWKGMQIGLVITLIASVMYALAWEVCYNTVASDFIDHMNEYRLKELTEAGGSAEEVEKMKTEMAEFEVMYSNPVIRFAFSMLEIFPVGLIISLISSGLLRKREFLPSSTT